MALKRKLRRLSNSLVVVIPSQLAEMRGLEAGMDVEVEPIRRDAIRVARARSEAARNPTPGALTDRETVQEIR